MGSFDLLAQSLSRQIKVDASLIATQTINTDINLAINDILNPDRGGMPSMFNIDDFRTNLSAHGELAKSDKFNVVIMVPDIIQKASGVTLKEITLQCEASELPSRDINLIEYRHYGFIKRIPHQNQYGQATFTFMCAGDMWEKRLFDRWMDIMVPTSTGLVTYPSDSKYNNIYEASIFINQFNANGQVIYTAQLIDAIPTSIGQLGLDWTNDQPHKLTVTFSFRKWNSGDSTTANVPATDFGRAVGGNVTLSPEGVSPINNQTNQTSGPLGFVTAVGTSVVSSLKGFLRIKL